MAKKSMNRLNDALLYIGRRDMHPGKGSTLKKVLRAARISAGLRPMRRPKRQHFPVGIYNDDGVRFLVEKAGDLHFTKGYRVAAGVPLRVSKLPAPVAPPFAEACPSEIDPRGNAAVAA